MKACASGSEVQGASAWRRTSGRRPWPSGYSSSMTRSPAVADVTVVIPTLGRSPFFSEALESALGEKPAEVLVVEDGGERIDKEALSGARVLRQAHAGRSV